MFAGRIPFFISMLVCVKAAVWLLERRRYFDVDQVLFEFALLVCDFLEIMHIANNNTFFET